jgi:TolB-like protein
MAAETTVEVTTTRAPENAVAPMHLPVAPPRWPAYRSRVASGLIGALAVAVAVGVLSAHRGGHPADTPHRVVVAPFANETGDTALAAIGRIAADWVAQGIGTTGLVQVAPTSSAFAAGRYADSTATRPGAERARLLASETGAGLVVSGGVYRVADSVLLRALIADGRDGHTIRELEPVTAPVDAPIPGIDVLRQRVLGALAPLVDERLVTTAANAGAPPSYQAYREMTEGIRQVVQQDFRTALPRFARAHALDTSYTTALLYAALAQANLGRWAVAESLAARADGSRHRLTPYDAAMLDVIRAWTVSNWPAAYEASVRGARIAPNSMAAVQVGVEAVRLNRPREAARVLEAIDPTRGELRGFSPYHITLADAYHLLGRYEDELRVARRFGASEPANPAAVLAQARALAAHGRSGEALALIDVRLAMAWGDGPPPDAMMLTLARELEAHGHSAAAATVWRRLLAWLDVRDAERRRSPGCRACRGYALAGLDRATESRAVFAALAEEDTSNLLAQRNLGVAAAPHGRPRDRGARRSAPRERDGARDPRRAVLARADRRAAGGPRGRHGTAARGAWARSSLLVGALPRVSGAGAAARSRTVPRAGQPSRVRGPARPRRS